MKRPGKLRIGNKNNYAESLELPHKWRTILGGFLIVLGIRVFCSDPLGNLKVPALDEYFYSAPVMLVAFFLLYIDWKRKTGR
jgi:hypothetical protein